MRVQSRRTDAFPTTWEIPVGIGLIWLLTALLALPAGQGLAYVVQGAGFVWPGPQLGQNLVGLLHGDVAVGLSPDLRAAAPSTEVVFGLAAVLEAALGVAAVLVFRWWSGSVGPLAQVGMATKREVADVLGRRQLVSRGRMIRPDLVGRRSR